MENVECGVRKMRSRWKIGSVGNEEYGKCGFFNSFNGKFECHDLQRV